VPNPQKIPFGGTPRQRLGGLQLAVSQTYLLTYLCLILGEKIAIGSLATQKNDGRALPCRRGAREAAVARSPATTSPTGPRHRVFSPGTPTTAHSVPIREKWEEVKSTRA